MTTSSKSAAFTGFSTPLLLLALACFPLGCATAPDLTLTSIDHRETYRQGFTHAYSRLDANGDTDVVLVDQATQQSLDGQPSAAPVRQVMHIRIVWSPTRDMKAVVSNAAVKWYVIGRQQPRDVLEYSGIAFVSMNQDDNGATLRVQNALLKPSANHGTLTDPVGPSRLEGTFVAKSDGGRVNQILSDIKTATAHANTPTPVAISLESAK
jgi:hypothetical protein